MSETKAFAAAPLPVLGFPEMKQANLDLDTKAPPDRESSLIERLPTVLQKQTCSFLHLDDVASLRLTSHNVCELSNRFLREAASIKYHTDGCEFVDIPPLRLIARRCRALQHLDLRMQAKEPIAFARGHFSAALSPPGSEEQKLLARIISNNRNTLKTVAAPDDNLWCDDSITALLHCAQLESFHQPKISKVALLHELTPTHTPKLRSLALTCQSSGAGIHSSFAMDDTQVVGILSREFTLTSLTLNEIGLQTVQHLPKLDLRSLVRFVVSPQWALSNTDTTSFVAALADVFRAMPALEELQVTAHTLTSVPVAVTSEWRLPSLRAATLKLWATLKAPQLRSVRFPEITTLDGTSSALELCRSHPHLERIVCHAAFYPTDEIHQVDAVSERFAEALSAGHWPNLTELEWSETKTSYVYRSLLDKPIKSLRALECIAPSQTLGLELLRSHPWLDYLFLWMPKFVNTIAGDLKPSPFAAAHREHPVVHAATRLKTYWANDDTFLCVRFPSLTALELSGRTVQLSSFDGLIDACPVLCELTWNGIDVKSWRTTHACTSLRKLSVTANDGELSAAELLALAEAFPCVREVELFDFAVGLVEHLTECCKTLAIDTTSTTDKAKHKQKPWQQLESLCVSGHTDLAALQLFLSQLPSLRVLYSGNTDAEMAFVLKQADDAATQLRYRFNSQCRVRKQN